MIDENTEGVIEGIVKAIVAGKKNELEAMEAFGIFDVSEELPRDAKVITSRWENVPKGDKWRCRFVAREFRHDLSRNGRTLHFGQHSSNGKARGDACGSARFQSSASMQ